MIIRMSVEDNDYFYVLTTFIKHVFQGSMGSRLSDTMQEYIQMDIEFENLMKLLSPNVDKPLNTTEKAFIIDYINQRFKKFVKKTVSLVDEHDRLIKDFDVQILESFTDKWENGEAFYWFQHSRVVINQ